MGGPAEKGRISASWFCLMTRGPGEALQGSLPWGWVSGFVCVASARAGLELCLLVAQHPVPGSHTRLCPLSDTWDHVTVGTFFNLSVPQFP